MLLLDDNIFKNLIQKTVNWREEMCDPHLAASIMCSLSHPFVPLCMVGTLQETKEVEGTVYCCPKLTLWVLLN